MSELSYLPSVWVICATISSVTNKHLLTTSNYHSPFHLLLSQHLIALALLVCSNLVYANTPVQIPSPGAPDPISLLDLCGSGHIVLLFSVVCAALSWPLWIQAMIHFNNISTLFMLSPMITCTSHFVLYLLEGKAQLKWFRARIGSAVLTCSVILFSEYRLTVNGLLFSLPAIILTGIARALHQAYGRSRNSYGYVSAPSAAFPLLVILFSIFLTGLCLVASEKKIGSTLPLREVPIFCLNLATSAVVIILGSSGISLITRHQSSLRINLSLVGLVACLARQLPIPAYTSLLQILSFGLANLFLYDRNIVKDCWSSQGTPVLLQEFSSHTDELVAYPLSGAETVDLPGPPLNQRQKKQWKYFMLDLGGESPTSSFSLNSLLLLITIGAWSWFVLDDLILSSLHEQSTQSPKARLDFNYRPTSRLDIVVSAFEEPTNSITEMMLEFNKISSITEREPRLFIYTKDPSADLEKLKDQTGAKQVVRLENVGREGETYLHHIISQWDDLATHTFFLQGKIHNPREFYPRIRDYFGPDTGMLSLGFSGQTCECDECGDRFGWWDDSGIVSQVYQESYRQACGSQRILLAYKGQFVASAARLRAHNVTFYQGLRDTLVDPVSWVHGDQYLQGRPDSLNAPYFGYTLERLWSVMLQCSEMRVASMCPTLLSGTRAWGSRSDCQCLDPKNGLVDTG